MWWSHDVSYFLITKITFPYNYPFLLEKEGPFHRMIFYKFILMVFSSPIVLIFLVLFSIYCVLYISFYIFFLLRVKKEERTILDIFLHKISKVPALIEVMRPFIAKKEAFDPLIEVHTETMISSTDSLYDVLSHNARLQNEFLFLMKLSMYAPDLQKHEYFLYIRDFIIEYERTMRARFVHMNQAIADWNRFVHIKNMTGIGYLLPGSDHSEVR